MDEAESCANCGTVFWKKPVEPLKESTSTENIIQQQQTVQPQSYISMESSRKTKTKLVTAVVAIIIVASVVVAAFFLIIQGTTGNDAKMFVGTWDVIASYYGNSSSLGTWTFYENGSSKMTSSYSNYPSIEFEEDDVLKTLTVTNIEGYEYGSIQWIKYKVGGDKLNLTSTTGIGVPDMTYKFSNDNTCTLTYTYYTMSIQLTLTRTSESSTGQAPIDWENINITIDTYETSPVHWNWINLTRSYTSYSDDHAPSQWGEVTTGDVIQIGKYESDVEVTITWIPTNTLLGAWYFEGDYQSGESGLISYWDFDEGTGNTLFDESGNTNNGIISTGANWVSGRYGSALEFVDTDIVSDISSSFDDSIDNAFTITSWVFWYGPNSGTSSSYIFDARGGSTSGFILMIDRDGNVTFSVLKSGSAQQITSESTISINTWTHIAAVFDYESKTISLFINGEEDIVTTATAPYYDCSYSSPAIGNNRWAPGDGKWASFNGIIDEIRIYNSALNTDEIIDIL